MIKTVSDFVTRVLSLIALLALYSIYQPLWASKSGVSGFTIPTGTGCGGNGCHNPAKASSVVVTIETNYPSFPDVKRGDTIRFDVIISHPTARVAGFNVSAMLTPQGNRASTVLLPDPDESAVIIQTGELTHRSPRPIEDGVARFPFKAIMPSDTGVFYFLAVGLAANGDGAQSVHDRYNFMNPLLVNVKDNVTSVENAQSDYANLPLNVIVLPGQVTIYVPGDIELPAVANVYDLTSNLITQLILQEHTVTWNRVGVSGQYATSGIYAITVSNNRKRKSKIIVLN